MNACALITTFIAHRHEEQMNKKNPSLFVQSVVQFGEPWNYNSLIVIDSSRIFYTAQ